MNIVSVTQNVRSNYNFFPYLKWKLLGYEFVSDYNFIHILYLDMFLLFGIIFSIL